ncbi:MAG: hypothetical protein Q8M17_12950 [Actinomycetota bacterium]|nr:hypothetical protein [Actinomycetota bacterium]
MRVPDSVTIVVGAPFAAAGDAVREWLPGAQQRRRSADLVEFYRPGRIVSAYSVGESTHVHVWDHEGSDGAAKGLLGFLGARNLAAVHEDEAAPAGAVDLDRPMG